MSHMKKAIYLTVCLLGIFFFSSCEKDGIPLKMIGTWDFQKIEFFFDGTLVGQEPQESTQYVFIKGGMMNTVVNGEVTAPNEASRKGNNLSLKDTQNGFTFHFEIIKESRSEMLWTLQESFFSHEPHKEEIELGTYHERKIYGDNVLGDMTFPDCWYVDDDGNKVSLFYDWVDRTASKSDFENYWFADTLQYFLKRNK